jgi:hypothetical protein
MKLHRGCITDPLAKAWWREYQTLCKEGNPLGLGFTEYVAHRVLSLGYHSVTDAAAAPWHIAQCGHQHPWGVSCSNWTDA